MKLTWTLALIIVGAIGLLANVQAVAQYGPSTPMAITGPDAQGMQNAPATQQPPITPAPSPQAANGTVPMQDQAKAGNLSSSNGVPPAVSDPAFGLPPDDSLLIDNGLWDGAPVGPCCAICGGGSGCPPDWYTEQGVRFLGRTRPREQILGSEPVLIDSQGNPVFIELTSFGFVTNDMFTNRSAGPDVSGAYAATVGHYFARDKFNRDHFVEFSFWGLNGYKDSATITALGTTLHTFPGLTTRSQVGSLYSPYFTRAGFSSGTPVFMRGFDGADEQDTFYSSYNQNFEINGRISPRSREDRLVLHPNGKWRRECQPGQYISYLYGIRFMQIDETFNFHSHSTVVPLGQSGQPLPGPPTLYDANYDVVTHNNLLGLQVGADMMFRQCRWAWGVRSKLGAFLNFSDQKSDIISPDLTRSYTTGNPLSAAKHEASLIGEVGFTATYKFRPNLMGRAGYDFMWVTGLALAPEQLQFQPVPVNAINTNGSIFYHGVSLGLEWMW